MAIDSIKAGINSFERLWSPTSNALLAVRQGIRVGGELLGKAKEVAPILAELKLLTGISLLFGLKDLYATEESCRAAHRIGDTESRNRSLLSTVIIISDLGDTLDTFAGGVETITGVARAAFIKTAGYLVVPLVVLSSLSLMRSIRETNAFIATEMSKLEDEATCSKENLTAFAKKYQTAALSKEEDVRSPEETAALSRLKRITDAETVGRLKGRCGKKYTVKQWSSEFQTIKAHLQTKVTLLKWNLVANTMSGIAIVILLGNLPHALIGYSLLGVASTVRCGTKVYRMHTMPAYIA